MAAIKHSYVSRIVINTQPIENLVVFILMNKNIRLCLEPVAKTQGKEKAHVVWLGAEPVACSD